MESDGFTCFDREQAVRSIAAATGLAESRVQNAVALLEDGNTLPFIALSQGSHQRAGRDGAARIEDALAKAQELARARPRSCGRSTSKGC